MGQSLAKIYVHLVTGTKFRKPYIHDGIRKDLHGYIVGILSKLGSYTYEIYANPEHIHILCTLPRTISLAAMMDKMKSASSSWMKRHDVLDFDWQNGYGGFSVSEFHVPVIEKYIRNQPRHHVRENYEKELCRLLEEYAIEYDMRYLFD